MDILCSQILHACLEEQTEFEKHGLHITKESMKITLYIFFWKKKYQIILVFYNFLFDEIYFTISSFIIFKVKRANLQRFALFFRIIVVFLTSRETFVAINLFTVLFSTKMRLWEKLSHYTRLFGPPCFNFVLQKAKRIRFTKHLHLSRSSSYL